MPNNEISEENFLTSLKRIERQYGASRSSRIAGSSPATKEGRVRRPPDEAGYALGKGLARSLLDLSAATTSSSISKEVQEETFTVLANRDINPAVCQGFFDALSEPVEHGIDKDLDLDDLFTACILFTEPIECLRQNDHSDDDEDDDYGAFFGPLTCMIRAYARYIRFKCERDSFLSDVILADTSPSSCTETVARTYSKLQTQAGRLAMLREFTDVAFVRPKQQHASPSNFFSHQVYNILNPLLTCSVLSSKRICSEGVDSSTVESMLCMEGIWRQVDVLIEDASTAEDEDYTHLYLILNVIDWLTEMLNLYLLSIASQKRHQRIVSKELGHRWLALVLDVGLFVAQSFEADKHKQQRETLIDWFEGIISCTLLRWFSVVPSYRVHMGSFWTALQKLIGIYASQRALSLESTLKISTMALCHPIKEDVKGMLSILVIAVEKTQQLHPIAISMIKGLGSIFSRDPVCAAKAKYLLQILARTKSIGNRITSSKKLDPLGNMIQVFEDGDSIDTIMSYFVSYENDLFDTSHALSAIQQAGSLVLFGIGLLDNNDVKQRHATYVFLEKLLQVYPHLGISLLPVIVDSINTSVFRGDGDYMMEQIEFLAEVVVRDSQCAREIWNLLGKEFMRESVPVTIRSSIIRLFPKVCQANKRLYKRVIEAMGNSLVNCNSSGENVGSNFELRLAIAASTADLARDNFIRDPTDVISWLQDFITDTGWVRSISTIRQHEMEHVKETMAHYSISALNSLVIAGELDFKLVLVVLRKKLCDIHNMDEVSRLPPLVLESLIILLGAGESEEEDSSDEDTDRLKAVGVSPHTSRSVETLVNLWSHECLRPELFADPTSKAIIFRCRRNILTSLTNYSFEALGVDEEGIKAVCIAASCEINDKPRILVPSGDRYNALKFIISDGIDVSNILTKWEANPLNTFQEHLNKDTPRYFSVSLTAFICKILKFEEETLGSSLWQKRLTTSSREINAKTARKRNAQRPNLSEQLPSPKSVLDAYNENRDQATSLGALLSFAGEPVSFLSDFIMDATSNNSDAMIQILYFQSWLNAARSVLSAMVSTASITESLEKLLNRMQECRLDNPDSTFMFLSAIATLIPTIIGPHGDYTAYISDISSDIWEAYQTRTFEDSDVAKLCLGLVGVCNLSLGTTDRLIEIVTCLEKTTTGYGGLPSFGAYYALAVIAQKCATSSNTKAIESQNDNDMIELKGRIVIFLINELAKCIKGTQTSIDILVNSIKNRTVNPEDFNVLAALQKTSLKVKKSKIKMSRSIFIALGICLPGIATVNEKMLPPILCFLESLEWGSGVGFCLHPILRAWCQSRFTDTKEIEKKYEAYSKLCDEGVGEQGASGLDEILYAMMAIQLKSNSHSIEKVRMIRNEEAGESVSLVLAVSSIASIPCLGHGNHRLVTDSPYPLEVATYADVASVVQFLSEVSIDMAMIMRGFLASLIKFNGLDREDDSRITGDPLVDELNGEKFPEAHLGTVSEIIMSTLHKHIKDQNDLGLVASLHCLEVIALPNQFSILVEVLAKGKDVVKSACMKLLVSQITGRPRAVFDGRDFVKLALKICKMSVVSIRKILGEKEAAQIFVDSFGEMVTKFISQDVEIVVENIFRFCLFQLDPNSALIVTLFQSIKRILQQAENDLSPRFSPKCIKSLHSFLQQRAFSGIHDATSSNANGLPPNQITKIVEAYAECIALVPETLLIDNKIILNTTESIGFSGECLRIRLLMSLIRNNSHSLLSHSYREITSSIAWVSQQLITCNESVFSPIILRVACTVAGASSLETKERKNEIVISFLDNLLMVDSNASFVCLEVLSAFVFQFCYGYGSDGDLSLLRVLGPSIEKWVDLPPELLKKTFALAVHDLPFNLARFTRREKLSGVVFNRLSRIYTKWLGQGSNETTLAPLRLSLLCCRDAETVTDAKDFAILVTSIVSKRN
jgi:hypothetical protein